MHVVSLQTGKPKPSEVAKCKATSIVKEPVGSAVITTDAFGDDEIVDLKNHGGIDQVVYIYTRDDYDFFESDLGRSFTPGFFGENLTFSNDTASNDTAFSANQVRIGDRYRIGDVLLEVTAPRIPCNIFADRLGIATFVAMFREAKRPGMYCRVLKPGTITAGDPVQVTPAPASNLGLVEAFELYYNRSATQDEVLRAAASPVSERFKDDYDRRLERFSN